MSTKAKPHQDPKVQSRRDAIAAEVSNIRARVGRTFSCLEPGVSTIDAAAAESLAQALESSAHRIRALNVANK